MLVDLNNYSTVIVLHWLDFFDGTINKTGSGHEY